jgi:uncharacterized protein (TIGR02300 family)
MSTKAERGTKRTCQNQECGSRFYDLNRDPIVCPTCQAVYKLDVRPAEAMAAAPAPEARAAKRPVTPEPEETLIEGEDALPAIEGEDEAVTTEEDETFLEAEEEDGSDMTNIIGGPVAETDEPDR